MILLGGDTWASDNPHQPDYAAAKAGGVSFMYFKRTQHVYPDPGVARGDCNKARVAGITVGEYHLPGYGPRASVARTQISAFRNASTSLPQRYIDMPPAIDLEGFKNCGWSAAQVANLVVALVDEFEQQLAVTPALYTSFFQIDDLAGAEKILEPLWRCPLFLKTAYRLKAKQPMDSVMPMLPHSGPDNLHDPHNYHRIPEPWASRSGHFIEQIQGDALGFPGHPGQADVNRFHPIAPGYQGPEVLLLRKWCANRAAVPSSSPSDVYDDSLAAVVRARQTATNQVADAIIGPHAFALLASA